MLVQVLESVGSKDPLLFRFVRKPVSKEQLMSTFHRMLKVLQANEGSVRGGIFAKGLLERSAAARGRRAAGATGHSKRSKRRRSHGELMQEPLERRQLLAVSV